MKCLRPVTDLIRLAVYRFLRDTQNPLSPHLPQLLVKLNRIEHRNQWRR